MPKTIFRSKTPDITYNVDLCEESEIGSGGMGNVLIGERVNTKTNEKIPVAMKFLFSDLSEDALKRARREASIKKNNDCLITMYDFLDEYDGIVVSELLLGVRLADMLIGQFNDFQGHEVKFAKQMREEYENDREHFAVKLTRNVLYGLMALHEEGYIHRDIDPSNIMLTRDGKIKLMDFGIAKRIGEDSLDVPGRMIGKTAYAPPELVKGDVHLQGEQTDVYEVGILLYELLCGKRPFTGKDEEVKNKQLTKPVPVQDIHDSELQKMVAKATDKLVERRYRTAGEFYDELSKWEKKIDTGGEDGTISEGTGVAGGTQTSDDWQPINPPKETTKISAVDVIVILAAIVVGAIVGITTALII